MRSELQFTLEWSSRLYFRNTFITFIQRHIIAQYMHNIFIMIMTQAASSPPCHGVGEPGERPEESSGRHQRTEDLTGGKRNIVVQMSTSRNHYCPQLGRESFLSKCPQYNIIVNYRLLGMATTREKKEFTDGRLPISSLPPGLSGQAPFIRFIM